jgi:rhamnosyltransferase subunit B
VHPSIAVAHALREMGHEGVVATNPYFAPLLQAHGVSFWPLGERMDLAEAMQAPGVMSEWSGASKLVRRLLVPVLGEHTRSLLAAVEQLRPAALVAHPLTLTVPSVSEASGVPWAFSSLAPISWMNPQDRPLYTPWDPTTPPLWLSRFSLWFGRFAMRGRIDRDINTIRATLGLRPEVDHWLRLCRGGVANLGMWSPAFRGVCEGDPTTGVITGFPWMDRALGHEDDIARVDDFLQAGEPPIVFTLGTASVHMAGSFFRAAADASQRLGRRAMLIAGRREYVPATIPKDVGVFTYAPYSHVFPRALVNVHHGGIGTTAQALRAGRPQLVTALAYDQFDNGARVQRGGAGLRARHSKLTSAQLADLLARLINEPGFASRAGKIAEDVTREDGARVAAEVLVRTFA